MVGKLCMCPQTRVYTKEEHERMADDTEYEREVRRAKDILHVPGCVLTENEIVSLVEGILSTTRPRVLTAMWWGPLTPRPEAFYGVPLTRPCPRALCGARCSTSAAPRWARAR